MKYTKALATILIITSLLATGCTTGGYGYANIGVGQNGDFIKGAPNWNDGGGTGAMFTAGYAQPVSDHVWVGGKFSHYSQWEVGRPFNDIQESMSEHVFLYLELRTQ